MNKNIKLNDLNTICVFDIETVGQKIDIENNSTLREFVAKRHKIETHEVTNDNITSLGGLYPETGEVVCISVGGFKGENFHVKSYYGEYEKDILNDFSNMIGKQEFMYKFVLTGHNIESFDIPFLAKRYLLNDMKIPLQLDVKGKQTWDFNFIDTMKLWAFGDNMNRVSLKVLCNIFNIPSSKDDIDGTQVSNVYYDTSIPFEDRTKRIAAYCQRDVIATARVFQKITSNGFLKDENIKFLV